MRARAAAQARHARRRTRSHPPAMIDRPGAAGDCCAPRRRRGEHWRKSSVRYPSMKRAARRAPGRTWWRSLTDRLSMSTSSGASEVFRPRGQEPITERAGNDTRIRPAPEVSVAMPSASAIDGAISLLMRSMFATKLAVRSDPNPAPGHFTNRTRSVALIKCRPPASGRRASTLPTPLPTLKQRDAWLAEDAASNIAFTASSRCTNRGHPIRRHMVGRAAAQLRGAVESRDREPMPPGWTVTLESRRKASTTPSRDAGRAAARRRVSRCTVCGRGAVVSEVAPSVKPYTVAVDA